VDIQVSTADADILSASNNKAVLKKLNNVTHTLKEIKNSSEQMSTYSNPGMQLSKELVKEILMFLK